MDVRAGEGDIAPSPAQEHSHSPAVAGSEWEGAGARLETSTPEQTGLKKDGQMWVQLL